MFDLTKRQSFPSEIGIVPPPVLNTSKKTQTINIELG